MSGRSSRGTILACAASFFGANPVDSGSKSNPPEPSADFGFVLHDGYASDGFHERVLNGIGREVFIPLRVSLYLLDEVIEEEFEEFAERLAVP